MLLKEDGETIEDTKNPNLKHSLLEENSLQLSTKGSTGSREVGYMKISLYFAIQY